MGKLNRIQYQFGGRLFLLAISALISACGSSTTLPSTTASSTSGTASSTSSSSLTISPSSVSLVGGQTTTFTASGGSGSGYTFALGTGGSVSGTITSSGYFVAAGSWEGTTYVIVTDSAGNATAASVSISESSTVTTTASLAISPSSVTLSEGESYPFTASGGSGSGYVYSVPSGEGTVDSASGLYLAPSDWTGTTSLEVADSEGNSAYATLTITSGSSGTTTTTVTSITGTLTNCVGMVGGSGNTNNWEVNGSELRTINDGNNSTESPVFCTGLDIAGDIPSTATIQGVSVSIFLINQSSDTDGSLLQTLGLINSSALVGSQKSLYLSIPGKYASFPTFTQGADSDTWGASLTPAIVNSSSFGIDIQTYRGNDRLFTGEASGILPQVTIYYSL